MMKLVLVAALFCCLGSIAHADGVCAPSPGQALGQPAMDLCLKAMKGKELLPGEKENDGTPVGLLYSCARCLEGVGLSVIDAVKGIAYFAKLLAVEAPKYIWDKTKQGWSAASTYVADWWNDAPDAVTGAIGASDANAEAHSGLMNAAKEYWQAFKDFVKSIGTYMDEQWEEFKCLPASLQSQVLCKLVFDVFMLVVTPDKILKGTRWAAQLGTALKGAVTAIKASKLVQEGTLAVKIERIGVAITVGAEAIQSSALVRRLGDSRLMEYVNAAGQKILKFEKRVNGQWVAREVMRDADTGMILRTTETGKDLLTSAVTHAAGEAGKAKAAIVVVYVNYLGKVNYFKGSAVAGDKYLKAVAKAIKGVIRDEDLAFRYGGDEFLLHLDNVSPKEAQSIIAKINKAVAESPEAREIFNIQRQAMAEQYRVVSKAKGFAELGAEVTENLGKDQLALAEKDFPKFQAAYLEAQKGAIQNMSKMRPTVSAGSTMIREGDTAETVVERASKQVGKVKGDYKRALGLDAEKYGTAGGEGAAVGPKPTMPEALLPD